MEPQDIDRDRPADGGAELHPSLPSWNLTRLCNLRCPHCYLSAGKKAEPQ